jgi:hypothetical protein
MRQGWGLRDPVNPTRDQRISDFAVSDDISRMYFSNKLSM